MPISRDDWVPHRNRLDQFEKRENRIWLYSLFLLAALAIGLAFAVWPRIAALPNNMLALPSGIVVLVLLFGLYAWRQRAALVELRGIVRGLDEVSSARAKEEQFEELLAVISQSQHGYRELLDSLDRAAFAMSLDGKLQLVNRAFSEIFALPSDRLVGASLESLIAEPSLSAATDALPAFLETKRWTGIVHVKIRSSGEMRVFDCLLIALEGKAGFSGIGVLAADITAERQSEARFTQLFETLQEGVYFSTREGKMLDANPAMARLLGYPSREELLTHPAADFYPRAEDRVRFQQELEQSGTVQDFEVTLRRKDGKLIRCLESASVVRDSLGRVIRYQGATVDITRRIEMEERLYREQEFVRRLMDSSPDAIAVLDEAGVYTFVSSRIQSLLGYKSEEIIGKPMGMSMIEGGAQKARDLFQKVVHGKLENVQFEIPLRHRDGSLKTVLVNAGPLRGVDGSIVGVVASARDVTESKKLAEQVLQNEKLAAMGQMLAGVAHELNNPLTALLAVSELLHDRASDEITQRQTEMMHKQAHRAADIVQSLLTFSRPAAPGRHAVRVEDLVRAAVQVHEDALAKAGVTVAIHADPAVPSVLGEATQLQQVFLNLITNAEQAIRETHSPGKIAISIRSKSDAVVIELEDTGPGIRTETLPRIFEPFFTTKRPGGGTGLGLTMSMALIKEHGGTMEAENLQGGGARFRVCLPAAILEPPHNTGLVPVWHEGRLDGRSLLVVEDEPEIRSLIHDGLASMGARVCTAAGVGEARALLANGDYDGVVCDLRLPDGDGLQLTGIIKGSRYAPSPTFVFITGAPPDDSQAACLRKQRLDLLQKPFRVAELASILQQRLASRVGSPQ